MKALFWFTLPPSSHKSCRRNPFIQIYIGGERVERGGGLREFKLLRDEREGIGKMTN